MDTIPFIPGPGHYQINVAGESFYPDSFAALVGPRRAEGVQIETRAQLHLQDDNEHDKHAVKVTIDGRQVGHLKKERARIPAHGEIWPAVGARGIRMRRDDLRRLGE